MKNPFFFLSIIILSIITLSVMRVVFSNGMSTSGITLDQIKTEIAYYKTQNTILKEKLLSMTSLDHIASQASALGFIESKTNISLEKSIPLAIKQ